MTTTGIFQYADPATLHGGAWNKVDADVTSYARMGLQRPVEDVQAAERSGSGGFGVDVSGFALYRDAALEKAFQGDGDATVRGSYYAAVEQLVRAKLSTPAEPVRRVVIFDHTIRRRRPDAPRQPVQQVHVDQTPAAAAARVRRHVRPESGAGQSSGSGTGQGAQAHTDADVDALLRGRYQIINVWRPIGHAASDMPLGFIDWRSTHPADVVPVDLLYPRANRSANNGDDRGQEALPDQSRLASTEGYEVKGETYTVIPNDKHRFYYVKDMTPDQVLLIKCFDSRSVAAAPDGLGRPGVAAWTPHTAFVDPATPADAKPRESIEVRCLVFYGDGNE